MCLIALEPDNLKQVCWHRNTYLFGNAVNHKDEVQFYEDEPDYIRSHTPECISEMMRLGRENGFLVTYNHPDWSLAQLYDPDEIDSTLLRICKSANEVVCNEMLNVIKGRMGTTASMLCFFEEHYHLCNIGDSPIFLFRDNKLSEISYEHTEKENYILIYGEENVPKDKKFRLTQHIGIFPEELQIEPYLSCDEIKKGDRFVICSDGLTDMLTDEQIERVLVEEKNVEDAVSTNIEFSAINDNIFDVNFNFYGSYTNKFLSDVVHDANSNENNAYFDAVFIDRSA